MATAEISDLSTERVVALARAAHEQARFACEEHAATEKTAGAALQRWSRAEPAVDALLAGGAKRGAAGPSGAGPADGGAFERLMKERAALQLQLQTVAEGQSDVQGQLKREQANHAEAQATLGLQRKKLKELEDDRRSLLQRIDESDTKLRQQVNETETIKLQFERLKSERANVSSVATGQAEEATRLRDEVTRLKAELEQARKERAYVATAAQQEVVAAEEKTADAAFVRLWEKLSKEFPDIFLATHVANERTFANVTDALLELVRTFLLLEANMLGYLKKIRNPADPQCPISQLYNQFQKTPLVQLLRDFVNANRSFVNFRNIVRVIQAWSCAFASGFDAVIERASFSISDELRKREWPVKRDSALGKQLFEAFRESGEQLGTLLRLQRGQEAYKEYKSLVNRK